MKKHIDFNTEKRRNAANNFAKDFLKFTMESLQKRTNVRLINNEKCFLK